MVKGSLERWKTKRDGRIRLYIVVGERDERERLVICHGRFRCSAGNSTLKLQTISMVETLISKDEMYSLALHINRQSDGTFTPLWVTDIVTAVATHAFFFRKRSCIRWSERQRWIKKDILGLFFPKQQRKRRRRRQSCRRGGASSIRLSAARGYLEELWSLPVSARSLDMIVRDFSGEYSSREVFLRY